MRRLALLVAGGALWLLAAAVPVLADGGPHISTINNGSGGLTADTCAGCHRAHTAQGAMLLKEEGTALCTSCHGSAGTGATTNVADGVQYQLATGGNTVRGAELGALRGGGFVNARIGSSYPSRMLLSISASPGTGFAAFLPVLGTGAAVTSQHLSLTSSVPGVAWGNGPISPTPKTGATVTLECTSCHNPHGNGSYRILNPMPFADSQGAYPAGFSGPAAPGIAVTDAAVPPDGSARNYTVQPGVLASNVAGTATDGDYWRRCSPDWQNCTGTNRGDKPNGLVAFRQQISAWCSTCHSRYLAGSGSATNEGGPSGDAIFAYRHPTNTSPECTQCHVSHGSNALMTGFNSRNFTDPAGVPHPDATSTSGDSRLLKVDGRGTCQLCHDPTGTVTNVGVVDTPNPAP